MAPCVREVGWGGYTGGIVGKRMRGRTQPILVLVAAATAASREGLGASVYVLEMKARPSNAKGQIIMKTAVGAGLAGSP